MYRLSGRKHREREREFARKLSDKKENYCLHLSLLPWDCEPVVSHCLICHCYRSCFALTAHKCYNIYSDFIRNSVYVCSIRCLWINSHWNTMAAQQVFLWCCMCQYPNCFYPFSYSAATVFVYVSLGVTLVEILIKRIFRKNMRSNVTGVRSCFLAQWTAESG